MQSLLLLAFLAGLLFRASRSHGNTTHRGSFRPRGNSDIDLAKPVYVGAASMVKPTNRH